MGEPTDFERDRREAEAWALGKPWPSDAELDALALEIKFEANRLRWRKLLRERLPMSDPKDWVERASDPHTIGYSYPQGGRPLGAAVPEPPDPATHQEYSAAEELAWTYGWSAGYEAALRARPVEPPPPSERAQALADAKAGIERAAEKHPAIMNPDYVRHIAANVELWADHEAFLRESGLGAPPLPGDQTREAK